MANNDDIVIVLQDGAVTPDEIEDAFHDVIMARSSVVLQEDVFEAFQRAMRRVY